MSGVGLSRRGDYTFLVIPAKQAGAFVRQHHYSHGHHNGPSPCVGMFLDQQLVGVCMFATPCSENVRCAPFGPALRDTVIELHRLVILDQCGHNAESMLIAASLKYLRELRPDKLCVVSFADQSEGHVGIIYQATNWIYTGMSAAAWFYYDTSGRLRHPRQNGHNVTRAEAEALGWRRVRRLGKHRYIMLLGSRRERRRLLEQLRLPQLPYPKPDLVHGARTRCEAVPV